MPAIAAERNETSEEIVQRLQINWDRYGETYGAILIRLLDSMNSGEELRLSGIERDVVIYALAKQIQLKD